MKEINNVAKATLEHEGHTLEAAVKWNLNNVAANDPCDLRRQFFMYTLISILHKGKLQASLIETNRIRVVVSIL